MKKFLLPAISENKIYEKGHAEYLTVCLYSRLRIAEIYYIGIIVRVDFLLESDYN